MIEAIEPCDYHEPPYDYLDSAEIEAPYSLSKADFVMAWLDSDVKFDADLASRLNDHITILYDYVYFYDSNNGGDIADYSLQAMRFRAPLLLPLRATDGGDLPALGTDIAYYGRHPVCRGTNSKDGYFMPNHGGGRVRCYVDGSMNCYTDNDEDENCYCILQERAGKKLIAVAKFIEEMCIDVKELIYNTLNNE